MTQKLYFDLKIVKGKQLLYKYSIFCQHLEESSEYISCGKSDLKDNYRVLKFQWDTKGNSFVIILDVTVRTLSTIVIVASVKLQKFDGCLYPIEYEEEGFFKKIGNKLSLTTRAVRIPETSDELNICFDVYAHNVIVRLERCEISDWQSLIDNYNTLLSVFDSFVSAEKSPNDFKISAIKFFDHRKCGEVTMTQHLPNLMVYFVLIMYRSSLNN